MVGSSNSIRGTNKENWEFFKGAFLQRPLLSSFVPEKQEVKRWGGTLCLRCRKEEPGSGMWETLEVAESQWLPLLFIRPHCQSKEEAGQQLASHTLLGQNTLFTVAGCEVGGFILWFFNWIYTSKTQACSVVFIVILQDLVNCEIELWILKLFTLNLSQSSMAKIGQSLGWIGNICSRYQSNSHHKVVLIWPPVHLICLEFCILTVILLYKGLFQLYGQLSSSFDMIINALHTNLNDNTLCCITIVLV